MGSVTRTLLGHKQALQTRERHIYELRPGPHRILFFVDEERAPAYFVLCQGFHKNIGAKGQTAEIAKAATMRHAYFARKGRS